MAFDEEGVDTGGDGGAGEESGAIRAAGGGVFASAGKLGGVSDIEADGAAEIHEIAQADEIIDEAVVAEERAALCEHDLIAVGFGEFGDDVLHF